MALRAKGKNLEEVNEECDDLNNQLNKVTNEKDALQMQLQKLAAHSNDEGRANRPRVTKLQQQINELQAQHPPHPLPPFVGQDSVYFSRA